MENKLFWIRGCKDNPEGVKKALENQGIDTGRLLHKMFGNNKMILFGVPGEFAHYEFFPSPLFYDVILQIGIELKPFIMPEASPNNTLYWCRGCYEDPDAVIRALNSKNIEIDPIPYGSLRMRTQCFFGTPGHLAHGCSEDSPVFRNVLQPFGVEIQPIFEKDVLRMEEGGLIMKQLYWAKGSENFSEQIKKKFKELGIRNRYSVYNDPDMIYFGCSGEASCTAWAFSNEAKVIMACGTEINSGEDDNA